MGESPLPPPLFQPPRITDAPLLPPPPPIEAHGDVPPYGLEPEKGFHDFFGPYTTDTDDSTNEDAQPCRNKHPLEQRTLESRRPPNNNLQRKNIIQDGILTHKIHIEELMKNLAQEKARSRPERLRIA